MKLTLTPGALKKFRRTPWRHQQTIERRPVDELRRFVSIIVRAGSRQIEQAVLTIDNVVFGTERMAGLIGAQEQSMGRESTIIAETADDVETLLVAALMDGPDFIFVPTPRPFVIYADHDDWITFYANTTSHLNGIVRPLAEAGFRLVKDWRREF